MTDDDDATGNDVLFPDRKVLDSGRVTLPKERCLMYDIEVGENYDITVHADGVGEAIFLPDVEVTTDNRVTIPAGTRSRYGINKGDWVDLIVHV